MIAKYLYIDDELSAGESFASRIGDKETLEIKTERPLQFEALIRHLEQRQSEYDGLILDWRLDLLVEKKPTTEGTTDVQEVPVEFRAGAIAQELRSRGADLLSPFKEIPIVLWSTYQKLSGSYAGDATSHDLFDRRYLKDEIPEQGDHIRNELISLAQGYKTIQANKTKGFPALLGVEEPLLCRLSRRFTEALPLDSSVHDIARFLLREVIEVPGPLLDEKRLAARLGVDWEASEDWQKLLEGLPDSARYRGPFCEAWPRWWIDEIEQEWWPSFGLDYEMNSLDSLRASRRVERLKTALDLSGLTPAKPIKPGYSSHFRTLCEISEKPLDPIDGILVMGADGREPRPWQADRYISLNAALHRHYEEARFATRFRLHPFEKERVAQIRKGRKIG